MFLGLPGSSSLSVLYLKFIPWLSSGYQQRQILKIFNKIVKIFNKIVKTDREGKKSQREWDWFFFTVIRVVYPRHSESGEYLTISTFNGNEAGEYLTLCTFNGNTDLFLVHRALQLCRIQLPWKLIFVVFCAALSTFSQYVIYWCFLLKCALKTFAASILLLQDTLFWILKFGNSGMKVYNKHPPSQDFQNPWIFFTNFTMVTEKNNKK